MAYSELTAAANKGNLERIAALLGQGIDINEQDGDGDTALRMAVLKQNKEVVQWLMERGADPYLKNNSDSSAIIYADKYSTSATSYAAQGIFKEIASVMRSTRQTVFLRPAPAEKWVQLGDDEAARIKTYSSMKLSLTDIFNFKTRERMTVTRDLESKSLSSSMPQSFDAFDESILREAFNQFTQMGGKADEQFVFCRRIMLEGKPRLTGK